MMALGVMEAGQPVYFSSRPTYLVSYLESLISEDLVEKGRNKCTFYLHQFTEVDEDDWDISSIEEDYLLMKDNSGQKGSTAQKNESNATSVVHAWGLPKKTVPKQEGNTVILLRYKS